MSKLWIKMTAFSERLDHIHLAKPPFYGIRFDKGER